MFTPSLFKGMPFYEQKISLGRVLGAEAEAFEQSLHAANIQSVTVTMKEVSEQSLGALFMLWQMVIAQLGEYLNVNAYDQPGVELGKRHAARILGQS